MFPPLIAPPAARRRFMSGVALLALIAATSIAVARYQSRIAAVALPALPSSHSIVFKPPLSETAAALAPATPLPSPGRDHVLIAPELRAERAVPATYTLVRERVLIEPERREERMENGTPVSETIPARYGYRERRVETKPASMVIDTFPAVWERRPPG